MKNALYSIAAVDPATGQVVELAITADSPSDAKARAEHCGLRFVVVRTLVEPPSALDRGGRGSRQNEA